MSHKLDLPPGPQDAIVANEGLVRDSLLKMVHNPGGDDCILGGGGGQPKS